jgi:hypothetical protein
MTRTLGLAVVMGIIGIGAAFAQTGTSTAPVVNSPAVSSTSPDSKTAAAPVAGKNSFTEAQARSRIEAHGYTNVSGLKKDDNSIWRGKATKGGTSVDVALDYQGNIVANN